MADNNTFLPPLPEDINTIAAGYADVYGTMTGLAADAALSNTALALNYGDRVLQGNYERFPRVIDSALQASTNASAELNAGLSNQYYRNLYGVDKSFGRNVIGNSMEASEDSARYGLGSAYANLPDLLMSSYNDMQTLARTNRENLLGMIPSDIVENARIFAAETANKQGTFGQAATNMIAKELGIQSLSSIKAGITGAADAYSLAVNPWLNQMATLQQAQQATGTAAQTLGATKAPIINAGTIFGANFGQLTGTSMMSPGAVTSGLVGLQNAGMNSAIGFWGNQAALAQGAVVQGYQARDYMEAQALLNKKGSPWGAVLGGAASGASAGSAAGPWGAVIGGVVGAGAGYWSSQQ